MTHLSLRIVHPHLWTMEYISRLHIHGHECGVDSLPPIILLLTGRAPHCFDDPAITTHPSIHLIYSKIVTAWKQTRTSALPCTAEPHHAPYYRVLSSSKFSTTIHEPLAYYSESYIIFMIIPVSVIAARWYASAAYAVMRCPSVCLSVTFVNSVKTNKHIFNFFYCRVATPFYVVFPHQTSWRYSDGNPSNGASKAGWAGRNRDSEPISGFIACCQRSDAKDNRTAFSCTHW